MKATWHSRVSSCFIAIVLLLAITSSTLAAPGDLDPTFGIGGKTTTPFFVGGIVTTQIQGYDRGQAAALQSDGKIIVASNALLYSWGFPYIGLVRYSANGSVDTSFGNNGKIIDNLSYNYGGSPNAVGVLSDGRIVVVGYVNSLVSYTPFTLTTDGFVALYSSQGERDLSFGTDGLVIIDLGGEETATSVLVQPDDKIVVGVYSSNYSANNFILARFNSDGSADTTFDTDGMVTTDFGAAHTEGIHALAIQTIGTAQKILAVGSSPSHEGDFAIARYNLNNGALDTTFADSGLMFTDFGAADSARAVAVAPDGSFVVAGSASNGTDQDFAAARYTANGALDSNFSTDGKVALDFGSGNDAANAVAIQADGKILLSGNLNGDGNIGLARYLSNGTPDTSFGVDGKKKPVFNNSKSYAAALLIQSSGRILVTGNSGEDSYAICLLLGLNEDGTFDNTFGPDQAVSQAELTSLILQRDQKILAAGYAYSNLQNNSDFALERYDTGGLPDPTFGNNGQVTTDFGSYYDQINVVAQQRDGKIVAAGIAGDEDTAYMKQFGLIRYNVDGSIDTSFGSHGIVLGSTSQDVVSISDLVILKTGKILVAGYTGNDEEPTSFLLARYNADGSIDTSFGENGFVITSFPDSGSACARAILVQSTGKIVVAGSVTNSGEDITSTDIALARYTSAGELDSSFGVNGLLTTDINYWDYGLSAGLQRDGKIVIAGLTNDIGNNDILLVRYSPDGALDSTFGTDGVVTTDFNGSNDEAQKMTIQADSQIVIVGDTHNSSGESIFAAAKYNQDGSLDTTFGDGGKFSYDFNETERESANGVAIQKDGAIVIGGTSLVSRGNTLFYTFNLLRLENTVDTVYQSIFLPIIHR